MRAKSALMSSRTIASPNFPGGTQISSQRKSETSRRWGRGSILIMEATGFDWGEIDVLLQEAIPRTRAGAEFSVKTQNASGRILKIESPELDPGKTPVSSPGMLWRLGQHRLFVGDATKPESYQEVLSPGQGPIEEADLVFTDPPYNVHIAGHVCGLGAIMHQEFAMAFGEMSAGEFTEFLRTAFEQMAHSSRNGAMHFICMDWRHMEEVLAAAKEVYSGLKNLCFWNKDNAGMGSLYRSKHELVFVFKVGSAPHTNHVDFGSKGRYRTNVWDYPGVSSFAGREDLEMHPTVKPVALVADAIRDCSNRNAIILDPFGGSGSTLIAAEKTSRRARLIEIDPIYADTIIRRWEKLTGNAALAAETGRTFKEMEDSALVM